jgi:hypothetical protein
VLIATSYDVAPREGFLPLLDKVYSTNRVARIDPQQLALVFIILAMGSLHCLELPPNDPQADEYLAAAKACLAKGDFMIHNTIPGLQALVGGSARRGVHPADGPPAHYGSFPLVSETHGRIPCSW